MLYWLLYPLKDLDAQMSFLRIFGYVSFRTVFAALTSLLIVWLFGNHFISFLQKINFKESIYEDGPKSHQVKANTPTMGGLLILFSLIISVLLWGNLSNFYLWIVFICTILLGFVGFRDDYTKSVLKIKKGMKPKVKLFFQILIALFFSIALIYTPYLSIESKGIMPYLYAPFLKDPVCSLGLLTIPFWVFVILGSSNSVNLTDGLDGLAVGLSAIVLGTLGIIVYLTGIPLIANYLLIPCIPEVNELCVFIAALLGACIGFLWFNSYPASIFMGDTGSLSLGGAIGMIAICVKRELLLAILCAVFIIEALSVIIQVGVFKWKGTRVFLMAPLHHHFELKGLQETKIVIRFWIIGILLALVSLSSLKII